MPRFLLVTGLVLLAWLSPAWATTPAEDKISQARQRLEAAETSAAPGARADALVELAAAHVARARERADAAHYDRALVLLNEARTLAPEHRRGAKIEAWARLGRHEFAAAAKTARAVIAKWPEDSEAWGLLGDALMELGEVEEAADAYEKTMQLRPGPGAYQRAAFYREKIGDFTGATGFLERALAATSGREREQRAWLLVQLAKIDVKQERTGLARDRLEQALGLFPDYHYALAPLASLDLQAARPDNALALAERLIEVAPHAEHFLLLADALRATGRTGEAYEAEDEFERRAWSNVLSPDNENRYLIDFYVLRRPDPARATLLTQLEAARRTGPEAFATLARSVEEAAPVR